MVVGQFHSLLLRGKGVGDQAIFLSILFLFDFIPV